MRATLLLEDHDMSQSASETFDLTADNAVNDDVILDIAWEGVTGTLNGTVAIYTSNFPISDNRWCLCQTYTVTASNLTDTEQFVIDYPMKYVKVVYTPNNVSTGTLNVMIYGRDL